MLKNLPSRDREGAVVILATLLAVSAGCTKPTQTQNSQTTTPTAEPQIALKKMPAGKEFSGFLKDYSNLKPNPSVGDNARTFVNTDQQKDRGSGTGVSRV
jgi:hypothetical protein